VNIFVGNLAFTTTEEDLRQLFEPYGTVDTIRMMTDRETGRSRGFGAGPWAWRRDGCTHHPKWVRSAVVYALNPSVRNSGAQSGANTCAT